jgi:hypothetical protein
MNLERAGFSWFRPAISLVEPLTVAYAVGRKSGQVPNA